MPEMGCSGQGFMTTPSGEIKGGSMSASIVSGSKVGGGGSADNASLGGGEGVTAQAKIN